MSVRSITAIIFALIVAAEVYLYLNVDPLYKTIPGKRIENTRLVSSPTTIVDAGSKKDNDRKYSIIIGATILVGAIVTFSVPSTKIKFGSDDE